MSRAITASVAMLAMIAAARAEDIATRTGVAAFGDWHGDAPGVTRLILPSDLPPPEATRSAGNSPGEVRRRAGMMPQVPPGFTVTLFAEGLEQPRVIRVAPNGDIFVAESGAGRIRLLRAPDGAGAAAESRVFVSGLTQPYGLAFYPPGPTPQWLYIGDTDAVRRMPYHLGDTGARGPLETVVPSLPEGGHWTRDIAFSPVDGRLYLAVGSESNDAEDLSRKTPEAIAGFEAGHGVGAAWDDETGRADVLSFTPLGEDRRVLATGLRNCSGLTVRPDGGAIWCVTNERDGLGDDLPPDYATAVRPGAFYGWPWYYIGDRPDPHHRGERPDLAGRVSLPDILIQPHSAPLQIAFYTGTAFPPDYRGDAFVTLHGSWNRAKRTGYKVVRLMFRNGVPDGRYQDFMTGFVADDRAVWGRPVGVAVARDGALLVGEDAGGSLWRVAWRGVP